VSSIELFRDVGLLVHGDRTLTAKRKKLAGREREIESSKLQKDRERGVGVNLVFLHQNLLSFVSLWLFCNPNSKIRRGGAKKRFLNKIYSFFFSHLLNFLLRTCRMVFGACGMVELSHETRKRIIWATTPCDTF